MPKVAKKPVILTTAQAAEELGCTVQHVRLLIRRGKLAGEEIEMHYGYQYNIPLSEIERYKTLHFARGWKRGKKHKQRRS